MGITAFKTQPTSVAIRAFPNSCHQDSLDQDSDGEFDVARVELVTLRERRTADRREQTLMLCPLFFLSVNPRSSAVPGSSSSVKLKV